MTDALLNALRNMTEEEYTAYMQEHPELTNAPGASSQQTIGQDPSFDPTQLPQTPPGTDVYQESLARHQNSFDRLTAPAPDAGAAVAAAQESSLGSFFDLTGTNANAPVVPAPIPQPITQTPPPVQIGTPPSAPPPVSPTTAPPAPVTPVTIPPPQTGPTPPVAPTAPIGGTAPTTPTGNLTPPPLNRPAVPSAPTTGGLTLPSFLDLAPLTPPALPGQTSTPGTPTTTPTATAPTAVAPPASANLPRLPGSGGTPSAQDPQVAAYLAQHPDILNNWQRSQADPTSEDGAAILGYGSLENYVVQDALGNGTPDQQAWAAGYTPPTSSAAGSVPEIPGENYRQSQAGSQTGAFNTTGATNTAQNQVTGGQSAQTNQQVGASQQDTTQQTTTGQSTAEGQTGTQTGTVGTQGRTTTGVNDTLGFGALLQGQTGAARAADTARQGFLTDLVTTGGANLNSQVDQAIRNSLTGPQMTGAGDSARARAAGYAGAEIARKNTGERLSAAGQLAGPSAVQTLASAGNPYLGQTQTTDNTQTVNLQNTLDKNAVTQGFQDLVSSTAGQTQTAGQQAGSQSGFSNLSGAQSEAQSGSATGSSAQNAAGVIPQAQQISTGGGGCIICTAGLHHNLWRRPRLLRKVTSHKIVRNSERFHHAARGYFFLFSPVARAALRWKWVSQATMPVANVVVYEEARLAGVRLPWKAVPWVVHWSWHGLCSLVGRLPVRDDVGDTALLDVAKKYNVFFKIGG